MVSPSGSLEPLPLKLTVSGAGPLVGLVAVATAVGGRFWAMDEIRRTTPES
jgi:hypothetical protein